MKTTYCVKITNQNYRCPLVCVITSLALDPGIRTGARQRPVAIGRYYVHLVVNIVVIGISDQFSIFNYNILMLHILASTRRIMVVLVSM